MMLKRTLSMMVVVVLLAVVGPDTARSSSRWRWWQNDAIITQLNLTVDEIRQLDDAYIESRHRQLEHKGRVEAERFKLEELLSRPDIDETAVREQNRRMESARSDLAAERFEFLLVSREILGHERFQKLAEIQRKWREERRKKWEQKEKAKEN